jgi:superfamily I DNA/RNA helicase
MALLAFSREIQQAIFDYNIDKLPAQITAFLETVVKNSNFSALQAREIQRFNAILQNCLLALQSKDYLELADLLEYEIGPMLALLDEGYSDGPVH